MARVTPSAAPSGIRSRADLVARRAGRKRSQITGFTTTLKVAAVGLKGNAQQIRERLPPQVTAYFSQLTEILSTGDAYASALGVDFGDWRDDSYNKGSATPAYLRQAAFTKNVLRVMGDELPDAVSFPRIREDILNILNSYKALSTALWAANGSTRTIFNGAVDLYDAAGEVYVIASGWSSQPVGIAATNICADYLTHSGYRRLRQSRDPGVHAPWNEVCDLWVEDYSRDATGTTWGSSFKWPRPEDPGYTPMPSPLRSGKTLLEPGCLPGEICDYNVTRSGLRSSLVSKFDLAQNIKTLIAGPTIDDVFTTAQGMLLSIRQLLTELIRHVNHLQGLLPSWGFLEGAAAALSGVKSMLQSYRTQVDALRSQGVTAKGYWRGSASSRSWRAGIRPYVNGAVTKANIIKNEINAGPMPSVCNYVFPKSSASSSDSAQSARERYWIAQGVPSRCPTAVGSFVPAARLDLFPGSPGPRGVGSGGRGRTLRTEFGSLQVQPPKRYLGMLPWQALVVAAGVWMLWPEKK